MTPRQKAWAYLLDMMAARFSSGDIGGPGETPEDDRKNEEVCDAGLQIVADLKRQGPPKERP